MITFEQAEKIRAEAAAGASHRELGKRWGIAAQTVARIVHFEIHRPAGMVRVPAFLDPADHALLTYLARKRNVPIHEVASELLASALASAAVGASVGS